MRDIITITLLLLFWISNSFTQIIINHESTKINYIPTNAIINAKNSLHIAYGHTSHGTQLISGMGGLISFKSDLYSFNTGGVSGALDLRDKPFTEYPDFDLGKPNLTAWAEATRSYLDSNPEINVIIWAWCGQLGAMNSSEVNIYLYAMTTLENDYPDVSFVYMTGHLTGSGLEGGLRRSNEQIRNYCVTNHKILYDFADIETYNPDGIYFGNLYPDDNCDYDIEGDDVIDGNWAIEWQNEHPGEWYACESAHSQPLNANLKAYAAWWLWARLAGWNPEPLTFSTDNFNTKVPNQYELSQNYPNPFNPVTRIQFGLPKKSRVRIVLFNVLGQKVDTILDEVRAAGYYTLIYDASLLSSGIYFYALQTEEYNQVKKMILIE